MKIESSDIPEMGWLVRHKTVVAIGATACLVMVVGLLFGPQALEGNPDNKRPGQTTATIELFDPNGGVQSVSAPVREITEATKALEKQIETVDTSDPSDTSDSSDVPRGLYDRAATGHAGGAGTPSYLISSTATAGPGTTNTAGGTATP